MKLLKKIIAAIVLTVLLFTSLATPYAYAQTTNPWYKPTFNEWYVKVYDEGQSPPDQIFGERYSAAQVTWIFYSLVTVLLNLDHNTAVGTCIINGGRVDGCILLHALFGDATPAMPTPPSGVLANLFNANRELSGVNYFRNKLSNLHIIPEARAQAGFGFAAASPVQRIWRIFRDIMYGLFVIVIIVFAFMIMFRVKINPQTAVSVQSALPKIVIALILVTFSYAIAGFMIDLMYVAIGLVALIFSTPNLMFVNASWATVFNLLTTGPGSMGIISWLGIYWAPFSMALLGVAWSVNGIGGVLAPIIGDLALVIGLFIVLGIGIWLIITAAKVFILLIKTYLTILIYIIFSPILIGFGSILPTGGFGLWLKGLISNLLVYPVVGIFLFLSFMFLGSTWHEVQDQIANQLHAGNMVSPFDPAQTAQFWYPPLTVGTQVQSSDWDPLPLLWLLASLAILSMIPKVTDIIKGLMTGRGVEGAGSGIGEALGIGAGYALGAGRWAGGGALDTGIIALNKYGGWRGERGVKGFVGRSLTNLAARRGLVDARGEPKWGEFYRRGGGPRT